MRAWVLPAAAGLALGLGALVVVFGLSPGADRAPDERAEALAAELRCPDCQGLSVADSPTRSAREIRRQIDELVADGATDDEVRAHFTARYGEWIRLAPSAAAPWIVPFVVVLLGVACLALWLSRSRAVPDAAADRPLSAEDRRRLHEEAEALDG